MENDAINNSITFSNFTLLKHKLVVYNSHITCPIQLLFSRVFIVHTFMYVQKNHHVIYQLDGIPHLLSCKSLPSERNWLAVTHRHIYLEYQSLAAPRDIQTDTRNQFAGRSHDAFILRQCCFVFQPKTKLYGLVTRQFSVSLPWGVLIYMRDHACFVSIRQKKQYRSETSTKMHCARKHDLRDGP